MNYFVKMLAFTFLLSLLTSCGADKLKPRIGSNQSSLSASQECQYTSENVPVCDTNSNPQKDYINSSYAKCFGVTVVSPGHCDCSANPILVCGSDGNDYTECDAKNNPNISIVKYVPCAATQL